MVTNECTTSTQHNPSSEANSSTASHKFSTFYACSPIQFFFENHLVIILPYMPRSSNSLLSSYIPTKPLCVFLSSPQLFHVPHPPYLHLIPPVKVIKWRWATQYAVLFSSLKLPLSPRYLPQHPILKHPQPMFFPKYDQPCFTPIYNNRHSIFRNDIPLWYMMINYDLFWFVSCCMFLLLWKAHNHFTVLYWKHHSVFLNSLTKVPTKAKTYSRQ